MIGHLIMDSGGARILADREEGQRYSVTFGLAIVSNEGITPTLKAEYEGCHADEVASYLCEMERVGCGPSLYFGRYPETPERNFEVVGIFRLSPLTDEVILKLFPRVPLPVIRSISPTRRDCIFTIETDLPVSLLTLMQSESPLVFSEKYLGVHLFVNKIGHAPALAHIVIKSTAISYEFPPDMPPMP